MGDDSGGDIEPDADLDAALDGQVAYYRRRAPVYDRWWRREGDYALEPALEREWHEDVAEVERFVADAPVSGHVLELAAGTGQFTRLLAPRAERLTAVDSSPETLALNRERVPDPSVEHVVADLFDWTPPPASADVVAFTYWLSHVPDERLDAFWAMVGASLRPGGTVLMVDSAAWPPDDPPPRGARWQRRTLPDGSEHDVLKRNWRPDELVEDLAARGWDAEAQDTSHGMILTALATRA